MGRARRSRDFLEGLFIQAGSYVQRGDARISESLLYEICHTPPPGGMETVLCTYSYPENIVTEIVIVCIYMHPCGPFSRKCSRVLYKSFKLFIKETILFRC